ncbi:MAG: HEPN domain-containing protein [Candidatus Kapaibacterium sp.]
MKKSTELWLRKAEGDSRSTRKEIQGDDANYDAVCSHAQQCIEKWMKGILNEHSVPFPKTHDLEKLLTLLIPLYPSAAAIEPDVVRLNELAFDVRYPIEFAMLPEAQESLAICEKARTFFVSIFSQENTPLFDSLSQKNG